MKSFATPLCALLIVLAAPAWADVSRDEAAAAAQRVASGRVLSVERIEADRRPVWRVKVLTSQGEVRVILIDAASGRAVG
jgi:Predicted membrane protein